MIFISIYRNDITHFPRKIDEVSHKIPLWFIIDVIAIKVIDIATRYLSQKKTKKAWIQTKTREIDPHQYKYKYSLKLFNVFFKYQTYIEISDFISLTPQSLHSVLIQ